VLQNIVGVQGGCILFLIHIVMDAESYDELREDLALIGAVMVRGLDYLFQPIKKESVTADQNIVTASFYITPAGNLKRVVPPILRYEPRVIDYKIKKVFCLDQGTA